MLAVPIPITCEPDKPLILVVLNPETIILSLSFIDGAVEIKADTVLLFFETKTVLSNVSTVVLIDVISFPVTLLTDTPLSYTHLTLPTSDLV